MKKALVIGNGESRAWFKPKASDHPTRTPTIQDPDIITWGCNAIHRQGNHCVNNLVAMDYAMQQEIYDSGWAISDPEYNRLHSLYFANWTIVPSEVADMMLMGFDIPETFIHKSKKRTDQCVISGKDPVTLHEKVESAIKQFPDLDMNDLKLKMEKDVGIWITYVDTYDAVNSIEDHVGWSAGNTALSLACQSDAEEVYILGFDLSSYDKPINNLYKGTYNYLPETSKGFNPINWINQISEVFKSYPDKSFYWIDCQLENLPIEYRWLLDDNLGRYSISKEKLCEKLKII